MAKFDQIIRAELNPHNPIPEIMQVIGVMIQSNPGQEAAMLNGLAEAISVLQVRYTPREKGEEPGGK